MAEILSFRKTEPERQKDTDWIDDEPDTTYWQDYRHMLLCSCWLLLIPGFGWAAWLFLALIGPGKRL